MNLTADGAHEVFRGAQSDVSTRIDGLKVAVEAARGRLDDDVLEPADRLGGRAVERLRLSGDHTIVALAGATGSGKSSLFNALTDLDLAGVGVRRPTTSWALACAWGPDGAQGLLEWMGIPARHQVSRMSMLDRSSEDTKLDGLVLLDLPDHDSTEVSHHVEMDRLVEYADLLVWVLDPQKYADAAIHDRYIRPMASYSDVTLVVLNQIDRVPYEQRQRALSDVRRILADEGLPNVTVLGVSASRGDGVDELKRELAIRIRSKASAKGRLEADVAAAAESVVRAGGRSQVPGISPADRIELDRALAECAGVPQIVDAITASTRRRARRLTSWPVTRWLGRLRKEPLRDLELGSDLSTAALARTVVPEISYVHRSGAESAIRDLVEKAAVGLEEPWREAVRRASAVQDGDIVKELDAAVAATDLGVARPAFWWRAVNGLQWLAFFAVVGGLAWILAELVADYAEVELPELPAITQPAMLADFSLPVVLAVGGAAIGIVLALGSRLLARVTGRRKARRADRVLRGTIDEIAQGRVLAPIQAELEVYERYRAGITAAVS